VLITYILVPYRPRPAVRRSFSYNFTSVKLTILMHGTVVLEPAFTKPPAQFKELEAFLELFGRQQKGHQIFLGFCWEGAERG
jgi:hypothetical protein